MQSYNKIYTNRAKQHRNRQKCVFTYRPVNLLPLEVVKAYSFSMFKKELDQFSLEKVRFRGILLIYTTPEGIL